MDNPSVRIKKKAGRKPLLDKIVRPGKMGTSPYSVEHDAADVLFAQHIATQDHFLQDKGEAYGKRLDVAEMVAALALPDGIALSNSQFHRAFTYDLPQVAEGAEKKMFVGIQNLEDGTNVKVACLEAKTSVDRFHFRVAAWRKECHAMLKFKDVTVQLLATAELLVAEEEGDKVLPVMVQEYAELGSLSDVIAKGLTAIEKANFLRQAVEALSRLHSENVVHGDVKPSNFLVAIRNQVKTVLLTDFGTSHNPSEGCFRNQFGTPGFAAPELFGPAGKPLQYTVKADMFSLGVMIFQLIFGSTPWGKFAAIMGVAEARRLMTALSRAGIPLILPDELALKERELAGFGDMMNTLMSFSPENRYTSEELLDHPLLMQSKQVRVHEFHSCGFAEGEDPSEAISLKVALYDDAGVKLLNLTNVDLRVNGDDDSGKILETFPLAIRSELASIFQCARATAKIDQQHFLRRQSNAFVPEIRKYSNRIQALVMQGDFKVQNCEAFRQHKDSYFVDWDLQPGSESIHLNAARVTKRIDNLRLLWPRTMSGAMHPDAQQVVAMPAMVQLQP